MAKILLVEDNEMNRDMLSRRLTKRGYEVSVALDGQDGIDQAKEMQPDLILIDMSLPVKDGWVATAELKSDPATKQIPVIGLSARDGGRSGEGDRRRLRRLRHEADRDRPAVGEDSGVVGTVVTTVAIARARSFLVAPVARLARTNKSKDTLRVTCLDLRNSGLARTEALFARSELADAFSLSRGCPRDRSTSVSVLCIPHPSLVRRSNSETVPIRHPAAFSRFRFAASMISSATDQSHDSHLPHSAK